MDLSYTAPYDWTSIVGFLAARAIPGVEVVEPDCYRRTIGLDGLHGTIEVRPGHGRDALTATIAFGDASEEPGIVRRIRRVFDLDADVTAIGAHLGEDSLLAPLVNARPGLRVPGAWDGFELAVRAMLGQQITVTAARRLIGRLAEAYGTPLRLPGGASAAVQGLSTVFPAPAALAGVDLAGLGMPRARAAAISGLAAAVEADPRLFRRGASLEGAVARLTRLPGIGEWTAHYVAMRALRDPDAFPAADVGLLRAMTGPDGRRPTPAEASARAEAWRPWRAYAAQHLWASLTANDDAQATRDEAVSTVA
jgi:AraC family transcriptional regulator of adaptative response / DNA-3-methyladenine glycosylase II